MRPFKPMLLILIASLVSLIAAGQLNGGDKDDNLLVVRAAKIYTGDGTVLDNGVLVIKDGKIIQTGSGAIDVPESAWSISSEAGIVTPGLIDASSLAGLIDKNSWTEHSSEIVPHLNVLDAVDLRSRDFERLVRQGVTTVFVTPGSGSVIGCRGCVLNRPARGARRRRRGSGQGDHGARLLLEGRLQPSALRPGGVVHDAPAHHPNGCDRCVSRRALRCRGFCL